MRDFVSLREAMDRLFEDSFIRPSGVLTEWASAVPCDLYETPEAFVRRERTSEWRDGRAPTVAPAPSER